MSYDFYYASDYLIAGMVLGIIIASVMWIMITRAFMI